MKRKRKKNSLAWIFKIIAVLGVIIWFMRKQIPKRGTELVKAPSGSTPPIIPDASDMPGGGTFNGAGSSDSWFSPNTVQGTFVQNPTLGAPQRKLDDSNYTPEQVALSVINSKRRGERD